MDDTFSLESEADEAQSIVPLIDVLLVLVMFLLTAGVVESRVVVPAYHTDESASGEGAMIAVTHDGTLEWHDRIVSSDELTAELQQSGVARVVIRADRDVAFQHVVAVRQICRAAGVKQVVEAVRSP